MQVLNIFHVLVAIALVALVLIQRGQGATAGAAFGSGASGTVFGARGAGTFLTRSTWVLAALYCAISLTMAVFVSRINQTPETDLGVVGTVQQGPVEDGTQSAPDLVVGAEETDPTDIPMLDPSTGEDSLAPSLTAPSAEDLPAADDTNGLAPEPRLSPGVEGGDETGGGADES